jgi:small subunit ribosomal protein S2
MKIPTYQDLLRAGVHLGHLSRKWDPHMAPFIFMQSKGMHIIDLNKTIVQLQQAIEMVQLVAKSGRKILFVATKKQAKALVTQLARSVNMPYITERWLGGTLTNFITIRKLIKKLTSMDRIMKSPSYKNMAKKEQLMIARNKAKLDQLLEGVIDVTRLPGALIVVDIVKESIAVAEATKLGIPIVALVDTNANPDLVDCPIPSNDDATPAIEIVLSTLGEAIAKGLAMREETKSVEEQEKEGSEQQQQEKQEDKVRRVRGVKKVSYTDVEFASDPQNDVLPRTAKTKKGSSDPVKFGATKPIKSVVPHSKAPIKSEKISPRPTVKAKSGSNASPKDNITVEAVTNSNTSPKDNATVEAVTKENS